MTKVLVNVLVLFQLSINLFECLVDPNPEDSVQTCFTKDNRPAFCADRSLCSKFDNSNSLDQLEVCPDSDKVCCPFTNGGDYRDAFVVPSKLAWDWTNWPMPSWATARPQTLRPIPTAGRPPTPAPQINSNTSSSASASPSNTDTSSTPGAPSASNINRGCGTRNLPSSKDEDDLGFIVGGDIAKANSWPWVVALNSSGRFSCGATIIDSRHILCAAHCVSHSGKITKPDQIKIQIGAHSRSRTGEYYGVEKVYVHSAYDERRMQNDISIFKLDREIKFNANVSPVCLPTSCDSNSDNPKTMVWLAGWGTLSSLGKVSDELREVSVPIIPLSKCQAAYDSTMVTSKQICAGLLGIGGKDTCQGDSGGALTVRPQLKENKFVQWGIVSWGKGCADPKYPGVYTKVCEYIDWIRDKTKN